MPDIMIIMEDNPRWLPIAIRVSGVSRPEHKSKENKKTISILD